MKAPIFLAIAALAASCGSPPAEPRPESQQPAVLRYPNDIEVTHLFGPLVIREFNVVYDMTPETHPFWSSWFYPLKHPYFHARIGGEMSPLEKYDYYARNLARVKRVPDSNAQGREEEIYQRLNNPDGWEGYCHATAAASIAQPQPQRAWKPAQGAPFTFTASDLKALLIRSYDDVTGSRNFGMNYGADIELGRDYLSQGDIFPDQLHRLIQVYLGERKKSFYIDRDASEAIWNVPVIKADISLRPDPADRSVLIGKMILVVADILMNDLNVTDFDRSSYAFLDEPKLREMRYPYEYKLHGEWRSDGSFKVEWGEWMGQSKKHHPDFATVLPDKVEQRGEHARNKQIDPEIVDEILERARSQR